MLPSARNTTSSQSLSLSCLSSSFLSFSLFPSLYYILVLFHLLCHFFLSFPSFPSFFLLSYPHPLLFYRLPLSSCSPPAFSTLSSSPNHVSTFILLTLLPFPSCLSLHLSHTLLQSPPHPQSLHLLRLSLLGTLYLLSLSLAASVYYLFSDEAGETERASPSEDFPPYSPCCCLSLNLKTLCWKIDCFRGIFFSFIFFNLFRIERRLLPVTSNKVRMTCSYREWGVDHENGSPKALNRG